MIRGVQTKDHGETGVKTGEKGERVTWGRGGRRRGREVDRSVR